MFPDFALDVLRGTPIWVFILFAYLLRAGLQQLQPNVRTLRRIGLVPVAFIIWGLIGLFSRAAEPEQIALCWLAGAAIGAGIAWLPALPMKIDRSRGLVWQPGSVIPLLRNMTIFLGHYLLHVAAAVHPQARVLLTAWDIVISGLSAGYFIAWSLRFAQAYAAAPGADLGESVSCRAATVS